MSRPGAGTIMQVGDAIYLTGTGPTPKGDRPFLDRFNLKTLKASACCSPTTDAYETVVALLDDDATQLITSRADGEDAGQLHGARHRDARTRGRSRTSRDPPPQLKGVQKQLVTYKRKDGVQLSGTIYCRPATRRASGCRRCSGRIRASSRRADTAGQVTGSPNRFTRSAATSHLLFLTQGYAIIDDPTMPIVGPGETANDTYIEQLVASAQAAVDKAVDAGRHRSRSRRRRRPQLRRAS